MHTLLLIVIWTVTAAIQSHHQLIESWAVEKYITMYGPPVAMAVSE